MIWVGTDDGKVQLTQNHGGAWTDLTPALTAAGAPRRSLGQPRVRVAARRRRPRSCRRADSATTTSRPYLYKTTDSGKTWTSIKGNLPDAPINVVVQDREERDLLIVGNDVGVFVSIDGGARWTRLKANLPTVAVHDLTIHPRENDLVLGTYGRAFWTGDITPLQELSADDARQAGATSSTSSRRARYGFGTQGMNYHLFGDKYLEVPNEPEALVDQLLPEGGRAGGGEDHGEGSVRGPSRESEGPAKAGLNRALVNLAGGGGRGGRRRRTRARRRAGAGPLAIGDYTVTVDVAGQSLRNPRACAPGCSANGRRSGDLRSAPTSSPCPRTRRIASARPSSS